MNTNAHKSFTTSYCNCPLYTAAHFDWSRIKSDATILIFGGRCCGRSSQALATVKSCCAPSDPCIIHKDNDFIDVVYRSFLDATTCKVAAHVVSSSPIHEQAAVARTCIDASHIAVIYDDVDLATHDTHFTFIEHPNKLTVVIMHEYDVAGHSGHSIPFQFDYIVIQRPYHVLRRPLQLLHSQCELGPYLSFDVLLSEVERCTTSGESLIIHKTLDIHTCTQPQCKQLYTH